MPGYCHQQHEEAQRLDCEKRKSEAVNPEKKQHAQARLTRCVLSSPFGETTHHTQCQLRETVDPRPAMKDADDIRRASIRYEISFFFFFNPCPKPLASDS